MLTAELEQLYFSQLALSVYESCPLKFRRRYIDGLFWPADWSENQEQKNIIEKGKSFHLLAQRYYTRGEDINKKTVSEEILKWFEELKKFRSYNKYDLFLPEYELRINKNDIKLVAKYDLLYINKQKSQIIIYDWKTNKRKLDYNKLKKDLQTKVYLTVFAEAGSAYFPEIDFSLEDISIVYWNPRYPAHQNKITYSDNMFASDKKNIKNKITEIISLEYDDFNPTSNNQICKYCEYRPICKGKETEKMEIIEEDIDLEPDWEEIEEINL